MEIFNRRMFNRNEARRILRDRVTRARSRCSRCRLTNETGPCPGCQKYICVDCAGPHFNENSPEYCLALLPTTDDGQQVDPLQRLVTAKLLEDWVAEGVIEVAGVDSRGRRVYRKL